MYKRQAHDRGKGIIVVVNKWDASEKTDKTIYEYTNKLKETLAYMPYAEYVFVSALTGQRMQKLFDLIDMVRENQTQMCIRDSFHSYHLYHYSMIFVNSRRPILEKRTSFLYKSAEDWYDGEGRYWLRILPEGD